MQTAKRLTAVFLYICTNIKHMTGNRKDHQYSNTLYHKLENCYALGVVDTAQYNIILKAIESDNMRVVCDSTNLHPSGQRITWHIICTNSIE